MNLAKQIIIWAFVVYAMVVACMFMFQRKLQYFPDPRRVAPEQAGVNDVAEVEIETPDGERLVAWYATARNGMPTFVYFQGNAGAIWSRADRLAMMQAAGYGVLLAGYRGYGGSTGSPTEKGLITDGRASVDFLRTRGVSLRDMVFYGESLGTGVAVQLAAETHPGAVVLESPFTAVVDVAARTYWWLPVKLLMKDPFRSEPVIDAIAAPLLVIHGEEDQVIPIELGKKLFAAAREPKQLIVVPGGGHNMPLSPEFWPKIQSFVAEATKSVSEM